jgi:hypothetical protein
VDFTLFVPEGHDAIDGFTVPNMQTTDDLALILTAHFEGGKEIWPRGLSDETQYPER